tara:strand:- start:2469 stop:3512 length:1044 start_codon:yes stop_codon:yes gene_type:complete
MPYIGKLPITGNFIKLDTISVVNGQAAYTMQKDSVNFSPGSANQMLVSLNGIIQNPGSSFTISGSTITFASNLVTGDVINYILVLGDVLNIGTPSDNTITNDKLATAPTLISKGAGSDSGAIQLNCEVNTHGVKIKGPPHSASQSYTLTLPSTAPSADKALITDGSGNLSFGNSGSYVKLATTTASSSSEVAFDNTVFTSTYKSYMIRINDFVLSTNAVFRFADSPDNGSTISFTSKMGNWYYAVGTSGYNQGHGSTTNYHEFSGFAHDGAGTVKSNFLELYLPYFTQAQTNKVYYAEYIHQNNDGNPYNVNFAFESSLTTAQNYIKFMGASGNITKGAFTVYGIVE